MGGKGGNGFGDVTYQTSTVYLHGRLRKLMRHGEKVLGDLDWEVEGHGGILVDAAHGYITDSELPDHCLEPMLCNSDLDGLSFGA